MKFGPGEVVRLNTKPASNDPAVSLDLFHNASNEIDRNRETYAGRAGILCQHCCIDADKLPRSIHERAARVALVDRCVGLNKVFKCRQAEKASPCRTHDSLRDRHTQAVGVTNRKHDIADSELVRSAQRHGRQCTEIDFQEREIGLRVIADELRIGDSPVRHLHTNLCSIADNVPVCDQISLGVDDHR